MNSLAKVLLFCLFFMLFSTAAGEGIDTRQRCLSPDIKTLRVLINGRNDLPPVLIAGSNDVLTISFDELSTDARYLRWSLTHCDADWQPENISDFEFTDGLNEASVDDYEFSRATLTHYVHYTITLPDKRMPIKLSGNYLLKVYEEYKPENPLLQVRFSVVDNSMKVNAQVSPRTDIDYMGQHQQLDITVDTEGADIRNFYTDLTTVVCQNLGDSSPVKLTSPSMVTGNRVSYSHLRSLIFPGTNEYRRFETVSASYPGIGIDRIGHSTDGYFADLFIDSPRFNTGYTFDQTQHGAFTVREYSSSAGDTEAEYITTNFRFESPKLPVEVHIDGALTSFAQDSSTLMKYNQITGCYEKSLFLKQGAYDYRYVTLDPHTGKVSTELTEGNFCDTSNRYLIYVYYRIPGERFDRLGGVTYAELHK